MAQDQPSTPGMRRVSTIPGSLNVPTVQRYANIRSAIRRGLPQFRAHSPSTQKVCLVGSGPSLDSTLLELRNLVWEGAKVVAMNGSYEWLLAHNIKPSVMVMIDGREFNSRFLTQPVPGCRYMLASQCHPSTFDKVRDWPEVYVWHCFAGHDKDEREMLDSYYIGQWQLVPGGSTVGLRSIALMRLMGFTNMELFGMDSCFMDGSGHALSQPENDTDDHTAVQCADRQFVCSAWMASQYLEFLEMVNANGEQFNIRVHGDGLLAHAVKVGAAVPVEDDQQQQLGD